MVFSVRFINCVCAHESDPLARVLNAPDFRQREGVVAICDTVFDFLSAEHLLHKANQQAILFGDINVNGAFDCLTQEHGVCQLRV
jgi:hypothetical protein